MGQMGLIHIYTGDGQGKTTAALGLALRACGAGMRVLIVQFLKGRDTAELAALARLGIPVVRGTADKFVPAMTPAERADCRRQQQACLEQARAKAPAYDLLVLDEAFGAVSAGMFSLDELTDFVARKPAHTELVLTGRDAPESLMARADYVSEIRCVRHPFDRGVTARRGIEY